MKALVTGGAGFLGSHLCSRLLERGLDVICFDNLQTGHARNVNELLTNKHFQFERGDVTELPDFKVDLIFNLACPASPPHYQADPIKTIKTSFLGALKCAELAVKYKAKLIHASTSEVYGDPLQHPQSESYWGNVNPIGIRSCYDEGKRAAESLLFDFNRMRDLQLRVVRIFNTYGPKMDPKDGRVVSNFIIQALQGQSLSIYGDGSQTRSFCYVDDLIDAILATVDQDYLGPINIGNPSEFTVLELAKKVLELTGSQSTFEFHPLPKDDPTQRRPDISLAKRYLNWSPTTDLRTGLQHTIHYFKSLLKL